MRSCGLTLVELAEVEAGYAGTPVLRGVSLTIRAGEGWAVLGPNGGGKSTLVRVVLGLLGARRGTVRVCGHPLPGTPPATLARAVAWVPQTVREDTSFTALELVLMGRTPHLPAWSLPGPRDVALAHESLAALDVDALAHRPLNEVSGGERRRVWLARALVQTPRLLVLDEPTAFLDLRHQAQALHLVRSRLSPDFGFVAVLHDVALAVRFATHAVLLHEGTVQAAGPVREVLTAERLSALYGVPLRPALESDGLFVPDWKPV
jgi:iron complex transport system ATP-binding protein